MRSITTPTSVPHLMALASRRDCAGPHRCYYCGAPCTERLAVSQHVKDSFTGRTGVVAPGSPYVCVGCTLCLRESCTITLIDGEIRPDQRMRGYSWLLTGSRAVAMTKAHLAGIRGLCLQPPKPPFAVVLTDSGQTHQLYRGRVNHGGPRVTVSLEAELISYQPGELARLLTVAGQIAAAAGKPVLSTPLAPSAAMRVIDRYRDGEAVVAAWTRHGQTGIGRLAAWLTPKKETAQNEYPSDIAADEAPEREASETARLRRSPR